jgi:meso-butanediol dehydrogenase/(S,S)-butanediol dehydrogenase/diacetyl reductase
MYSDLEGKVAVITGAGRHKGLGAAIARKLAEDGVKIVLHDVEQSKNAEMSGSDAAGASELQQVAEEIRAIHPDIVTHTADLQVETEVESLIAKAVAQFGKLDILVNNAGVGYLFGPFVEQTEEMWNMVLDVNLRGAFFAMKHAVRQMLTQDVAPAWGRGRIVSIGSRGSKSGSALTSSYIASKHGLVGLTRAVAIEMGPQQINVNMVCPNHVTTGLGAWQNDYMAKMRGQSVDDYLDAMRQRIPLGRLGTPEDTANACAFLCSAQARYITGEAMNVSGGEEMH